MDAEDQAIRTVHDQIAQRIEIGTATSDDVTCVLSVLKDVRPRTTPGDQHPRLDSADDFETWVTMSGHGELYEVHQDQSKTEHVVGYYEAGCGQGHGQSRRIGAAMWAAFIRATMCPELCQEADETPRDPAAPRVHVVTHRYQIGDLSVPVEVPAGLEGARIAAYIQLACEDWHFEGAVVLPQTVVEAMIRFYGCSPAPRPAKMREDDEIDLYWERERFSGDVATLMVDASIMREGLRDFLRDRYEV